MTAGRPSAGWAVPRWAPVAVQYGTGAVVLWVLLNVVLWPKYGVATFTRPLVPVLAVLVLAALPFLYRACAAVGVVAGRHPRARRAALSVLLAGFLVVQTQIGRAIAVMPDWDAGVVLRTAFALTTGDIEQVDDPYFHLYPNNLLLVTVLHGWLRIAAWTGAEDLLVGAIVLNALALTTAVLLTYLAAYRLRGPGLAIFTLPFSALFLVLSPHVAVPYSDSVGAVFPVGILYLFLVARRVGATGRRAALWAGIGALGYLGYAIKPTAVFAVVAVALVELARHEGGGRAAVRALMVVTAGLALLLTAAVVGAGLARSGLVAEDIGSDGQNMPATHFLMMGAQTAEGPHNDFFGAYRHEDVERSIGTPPDERVQMHLEEYADRVQQMGPGGYLVFLNGKATWVLGDGSFFMWGEGAYAALPFEAQDPVSRAVQEWFADDGSRHQVLLDIWQTGWLALLGAQSVSLLARRETVRAPGPTAMRLAVLALLAFLLLFEGRSRYVYLYVPYFVLLGSVAVDALLPRRPRAAGPAGTARTTEEPVDRSPVGSLPSASDDGT